MADLLKGFRQLLRDRKNKTPKGLMNNAPWVGQYDRSSIPKELLTRVTDKLGKR